jgi:hypothetical protein
MWMTLPPAALDRPAAITSMIMNGGTSLRAGEPARFAVSSM